MFLPSSALPMIVGAALVLVIAVPRTAVAQVCPANSSPLASGGSMTNPTCLNIQNICNAGCSLCDQNKLCYCTCNSGATTVSPACYASQPDVPVVQIGSGSCQAAGTYPNCNVYTSLSVWKNNVQQCLGVPAGVQMSVVLNDHSNDDYLNLFAFDGPNYNAWQNKQPSSCLSSTLCFNQGSQSSGLPDPKSGSTTTTASTTDLYVVIENNNPISHANFDLSVQFTAAPTPGASSTGGNGGGGDGSTGGASSGSMWLGTWRTNGECDETRCCCLDGNVVLDSSGNELTLTEPLSGQCNGNPSISFSEPMPTGDTLSFSLGGQSYTAVVTGSHLQLTNNVASFCSGSATRVPASGNTTDGSGSGSGKLYVGLGVGFGLVFVILLGVSCYVSRRSRSKQNAKAAEPQTPGAPYTQLADPLIKV